MRMMLAAREADAETPTGSHGLVLIEALSASDEIGRAHV
jgi:hypothetical protein